MTALGSNLVPALAQAPSNRLMPTVKAQRESDGFLAADVGGKARRELPKRVGRFDADQFAGGVILVDFVLICWCAEFLRALVSLR